MGKLQLFQQQIDVLACGEVQPLLFATDVSRGARLTVHVVLLDPREGVEEAGHTTSMPLFVYEAEASGQADDEEVARVRAEALNQFAQRLKTLLNP